MSNIDRDPNGGPPPGDLNGDKNRPVQADSERLGSSENSQGDTDEDTRVRAGVEPNDEEE